MKYILLLCCFLCFSCQQEKGDKGVIASCYKLKPLTKKKHPIRSGEWRSVYTEAHEPLQDYISRNPTSTTATRNKLYIVQLGPFDKKGVEILNATKDYLRAFFQIEVVTLPAINRSSVEKQYTRQNDYGLQLQTTVILDSILPALLPSDAFALIAFTTNDLFPDDTWNYVFGQASLERRVGVWSLARLGDYNKDTINYSHCLNRTMKIAVHETGHIFGIHHCVQNECCMNGGNSLTESDSQPDWFCWECSAKICWNRKVNPEIQIASLLKFHESTTHNRNQIQYYKQALKLLSE